MPITILSAAAAAGGGFPLWNGNRHHRAGARNRTVRAKTRTRSSIFIRSDAAGHHAALLPGVCEPLPNCCPRMRSSSMPSRSPKLDAPSIGDAMKTYFVAPDYPEGKARKCVNGWGSMFMTITPDGFALPCHTARRLPGLAFSNAKASKLRDIWLDSDGFNRYRGTGWMKQSCTSCAHREEGLVRCTCQACMLAQDAEATDPVCRLSHLHHTGHAALAEAATVKAQEPPLVLRNPANSRLLSL